MVASSGVPRRTEPQTQLNGKAMTMARIGVFTTTANGYSGRLKTLTLDVELTLVPADAGDGETAPDYRIYRGAKPDGPEVGAGWKHTGKNAGNFISLLIDDPVFSHPIRANLFQADESGSVFDLIWLRPAKRAERT